MNKKYISLGVLAATFIFWCVGPIFTVSLFGISNSATVFDLLGDLGSCGLADYLIIFAPLAAVVLGALGIFKDAKFSKIGGFVGAGGTVLSVLLYCTIVEGMSIEFLGWGVWVLLILTVANLVINLKAEN